MKTARKITCLASVLAMLASAAALPASAVEKTPVTAEAVSKLNLEVTALENAGAITAEEAQMLADTIASVQDDSFTYAHYDDYAGLDFSPTTHYLALLAKSGQSIKSGDMHFYLNNNIVTDGCDDLDLLSLGREYKDNSRLSDLEALYANYQAKKMVFSFKTTLLSTPSDSAMVTYRISDILQDKAKASELDLHRNTSDEINPDNPSTTIKMDAGFYLEKCIFSLGDVDRNGIIDGDDSNLILRYLLHLGSVEGDRELDQTAFELAADFNEDGIVDLIDIVDLNKYRNTLNG